MEVLWISAENNPNGTDRSLIFEG